MDAVELADLLSTLRRIGGEPDRVEVKRAQGGVPHSARATLSAFANTDGGVLVLGVDEAAEFQVVHLDDPARLRDQLVQMSRDDLTPPLQVSTDIIEAEGQLLVVVDVPPVRADQRPVYVTSRGVTGGSYLRTGDGDRLMSQAEIALVVANRSQPTYDREPVPGTSRTDLVEDSLRRTLQRVRTDSPRFSLVDDATALCRLGITIEPTDRSPLTLAGLLAFGQFPQQWFPQLMVSVAVHPAEPGGRTRFVDNASARGPIPEQVESAVAVLRRHLAVRARTSERGGRIDEDEYPLAAVREAVVNAVMHRDYSPVTRGTQVQVDLYPDRLVVRSPGGLFGGVSVADLGEEGVSSSRNAVLASLLSDTFLPTSPELVAENRSSGIPMMLAATRRQGLPRPSFHSAVASFVVTMPRSELLSPEVRAWMTSLDAALPTPAHEIALAMLRTGSVTNAALRQWGVDRVAAGQVLRDLVQQGLAVKEGGRRYAQYVLDPAANGHSSHGHGSSAVDRPSDAVAEALRAAGSASTAEITSVTGLARSTVTNHLQDLVTRGLVAADGAVRSPKRRYRWLGDTP